MSNITNTFEVYYDYLLEKLQSKVSVKEYITKEDILSLFNSAAILTNTDAIHDYINHYIRNQ